MSEAPCVGVLMAGGASRRFGGAPKGLATIEGVRIADRALSALREATSVQLIVANDDRARRWFPGMRIERDAKPGVGPLAGIGTALRAADGAAVLIVAWDMPFVSGALLAALRALGEAGATAAAPAHGEPLRLEPLCAYYPAHALQRCDQLIERGERRAVALFAALAGARRLEGDALTALGDPARLLRSVDTAAALAALGGVPPDDERPARR